MTTKKGKTAPATTKHANTTPKTTPKSDYRPPEDGGRIDDQTDAGVEVGSFVFFDHPVSVEGDEPLNDPALVQSINRDGSANLCVFTKKGMIMHLNVRPSDETGNFGYYEKAKTETESVDTDEAAELLPEEASQ